VKARRRRKFRTQYTGDRFKLDTLLPERVHCNNPTVVKKPVSKFRSKKPKYRGTRQRVEVAKFHITNKERGFINLQFLFISQLAYLKVLKPSFALYLIHIPKPFSLNRTVLIYKVNLKRRNLGRTLTVGCK
jgi:hypothetical protein